jgi:hypothetical protein
MEPIELTLPNGRPVTVGALTIAYFHPGEDGTNIVFAGGGSVTVQESYEALSEMFNPERQAAEPC